jgi:hypothetical protein
MLVILVDDHSPMPQSWLWGLLLSIKKQMGIPTRDTNEVKTNALFARYPLFYKVGLTGLEPVTKGL